MNSPPLPSSFLVKIPPFTFFPSKKTEPNSRFNIDRRSRVGGDVRSGDVRAAGGGGGAAVPGGDDGGGGDRGRDYRRVHREEQHRAAWAGSGHAESVRVRVLGGGACRVLHQRRLCPPPRSSGESPTRACSSLICLLVDRFSKFHFDA